MNKVLVNALLSLSVCVGAGAALLKYGGSDMEAIPWQFVAGIVLVGVVAGIVNKAKRPGNSGRRR